MAINLRKTSADPTGKVSALTHQEMNDNLKSFYQSSSLSGSTLELHTVADTHSIDLSSLGGTSVDISDLNTFSGSAESRLDSIEAVTSSYLTPADTGSLYLSSSVDQNRITFNQGDGSSHTIVIETGSADDSITYFTESISGNTATWNTSFEDMSITSTCNRIRIGADITGNVHTGDRTIILGGNHDTQGFVSATKSLAAQNSSTQVSGDSNIALGNFSGCITSGVRSVMIGVEYGNVAALNTFVLGGSSNSTSGNANYGGIIGGSGNSNISSKRSVVVAGSGNMVQITEDGGIFAGRNNAVRKNESTVIGGFCNRINSKGSNITGGCCNCVTGDYSTILSSKKTTLQGEGSLVFSPSDTVVTEARSNIARFDVTLLEVSGALSASGLTYPTTDGTTGQAIVTDGSGVLSFATVSGGSGPTLDTGSFYVSSSINGNSITYLQGDGTTEVVNIPVGGVDTGSFYVSSSVDRNIVTFTQGDGSVESITIETGSADDVITEWVESTSGGKSSWTSTTPIGIIDSTSHTLSIGTTSVVSISGNRSSIISGCRNRVTADDSTVIAGCCNHVTQGCAGIFAGRKNSVQGAFSTILGGYDNMTNCNYVTIAGAYDTTACVNYSFIAATGASNIKDSSQYSTILGTQSSDIEGASCHSTILGSQNSEIKNSVSSTVIGGLTSYITNSDYSTVIGRDNSIFSGSPYSGIFGGVSNRINGGSCFGVILGGISNRICATGNYNSILAGSSSTISGTASKSHIIGGSSNTVSGNSTLLFGGTSITETRDSVARFGTDLVEVDGHFSASGLLYPTASGTAGQVITTDGNGVLSFTTVGGGGASTLLGLTDTDLTPTIDTGSLLYWNGGKWIADNTPRTLGIQDANTLINVVTPNTSDVILFEEGEGLAISYDTNTVTFDIDLDWSSSYVDATQASSVWETQGTDTHINAVLQAKGDGATVAQVPDGSTVGGNSRGGQSTDFQKLRSDANQVASGVASSILGGSCNRAYGNHSTVLGGQENTAGGTFSTVLGGYQSCVGSTGTYSTALGNRAQVNAFGSFLFRDGSGTTPYTLTDNNTAAFITSKFYVEGIHEVSGSSFSSVGTPDTTATSPTTVNVTIDADEHNFFELTLGTNTTHTVGITNGQPGQTIIIKTVQPSSGTVGLVSWNGTSNIKEAFDADNNVTALNDAEDIFTLVSFGTDWYLNGIKRFS